jgi:hypothetical protein
MISAVGTQAWAVRSLQQASLHLTETGLKFLIWYSIDFHPHVFCGQRLNRPGQARCNPSNDAMSGTAWPNGC